MRNVCTVLTEYQILSNKKIRHVFTEVRSCTEVSRKEVSNEVCCRYTVSMFNFFCYISVSKAAVWRGWRRRSQKGQTASLTAARQTHREGIPRRNQ